MRFKSHDMSMRQHLVVAHNKLQFSHAYDVQWKVSFSSGSVQLQVAHRCTLKCQVVDVSVNQLEGTCSWHLPVAQSFRWEGHWMASHLYGWQGGGSHSEDNPMLLRHLVLLCIVSSMPTPACHHLLVHEAKKTHAVFTKEYSGNSHYKYSSNTW